MSMRTIVAKKVTNAAITIVIILVANFILFRLLPGDPAITFIRTGAGHSANPELLNRQREDRKSTRLNSSHSRASRMPSSA